MTSRRTFLKQTRLSPPVHGLRFRPHSRSRPRDPRPVRRPSRIPRSASSAGAPRTASTSFAACRTARIPPARTASCRRRSRHRGQGTRDAVSGDMSLPQPLPSGNYDYTRAVQWATQPGGRGEDCLVLNICTPALKDGGKRAVMFSIHGGGYTTGTSHNPVFDGGALAHRGDVMWSPSITGWALSATCIWANSRPNSRSPAWSGMMDMVAGPAVGARQHRELRRRSRQGDDLRPVRRRSRRSAT